MDHSVLGFSQKMKVLHIDLIERSITEAEIAIWSFQLLWKSDGSSPTYLPKCSIGAPLSPSKQLVMVSRCGLSSAGSALVESSNCKVFCTQQRHCDRHIVCHIPGAGHAEWKCSSFHSIKVVVSQVGALLLLNTLHLHSRVKAKAPPKPLQAEHSSNFDIWLLAWTLPISHEQWWVLKLQGYAKYLQHCIRPLSSVTSVPSFHVRKALSSEI